MENQNKKLCPFKEVYCIHCYAELILSLSERRGDEPIVCPECNFSFSIKDAEDFIKNLNPIVEGKCPNCSAILLFSVEDRNSEEKISCPTCNDLFYMNEVEEPLQHTESIRTDPRTKNGSTTGINKTGTSQTMVEVLLKNYKIYVLLTLFLDFFFIFTFLSLSESSKIKDSLPTWREEDKITYNTWHTVFKTILILKVVFILFGVLSSL